MWYKTHTQTNTDTHLLFGKFDFLQIIFSVNVDLSNVATESQQGPNEEREVSNRGQADRKSEDALIFGR